MGLVDDLLSQAELALEALAEREHLSDCVEQESVTVAGFALYEIVFLQLLQVKS